MPEGEGMRGGMGMGGGMMGGMMGHMMEHMAPMMGPMMRVMIFSPGHLLMHKQQLNLTEAQVAKLTSLRDAARSAEESANSEAEKHGRELAETMGGANADTAALKAHFQAMHAAMGKAHWIGLVSAAQARAVLSDVQRARADGWADAMEWMMHGMGGGPERGEHRGMRGEGEGHGGMGGGGMGGRDTTRH